MAKQGNTSCMAPVPSENVDSQGVEGRSQDGEIQSARVDPSRHDASLEVHRVRSGPTGLITSIERARSSSIHVDSARSLSRSSSNEESLNSSPRATEPSRSRSRYRRLNQTDSLLLQLNTSRTRRYRQPRSGEWIGNFGLSPRSTASPGQEDQEILSSGSFGPGVGSLKSRPLIRRRDEINEQLAARRSVLVDPSQDTTSLPVRELNHTAYLPEPLSPGIEGSSVSSISYQQEPKYLDDRTSTSFRASRRHPAFEGRPALRDTMLRPRPRRIGSASTISPELSIAEENEDEEDEAGDTKASRSHTSPGQLARGRYSQRTRPQDLHFDRTRLNPDPLVYYHYPPCESLFADVPVPHQTPPLLPRALSVHEPRKPPPRSRIRNLLRKRRRDSSPEPAGETFIKQLQNDLAPPHWALRIIQFLAWAGLASYTLYVAVKRHTKLAFDCFELETQVLSDMGLLVNSSEIWDRNRSRSLVASDVRIPERNLHITGRRGGEDHTGAENGTSVCAMTPLVKEVVLFDSFVNRLLVGTMCVGISFFLYQVVVLGMSRVMVKSGVNGRRTLAIRATMGLVAAVGGSAFIMGLLPLIAARA